MNDGSNITTLLNIPLIRERYGPAFAVSMGIHALFALLLVFGGYLLPTAAVQIGSGQGGGRGGDIATVGLVDELSGGAGMYKPSIVPQPPALEEKPSPPVESKAIPIPESTKPQPKKPAARQPAAKPDSRTAKPKPLPDTNLIPTRPEPGSGGIGGRSGGSGGGFGGGSGISIGSGSGGFGDSAYARAVENRISSNWIRPPEGVRVEMIFSFFILPNGSITGIKKEKSSGRPEIDLGAERAIRASHPLTPPPPEFRGRPIQFVAQFIYPPTE